MLVKKMSKLWVFGWKYVNSCILTMNNRSMSLTLDSKFTSVGRQRHFAMDIRPYVSDRFVFSVTSKVDLYWPWFSVRRRPGLFQSKLLEHFFILEFKTVLDMVQIYFGRSTRVLIIWTFHKINFQSEKVNISDKI